MNAFVERFVQNVKSEALNFFMIFGLEHFDLIVSEFVEYYHEQRPHQGLGNMPLPKPGESSNDSDDEPKTLSFELSQIKCETRLGGLLRSYLPRRGIASRFTVLIGFQRSVSAEGSRVGRNRSYILCSGAFALRKLDPRFRNSVSAILAFHSAVSVVCLWHTFLQDGVSRIA